MPQDLLSLLHRANQIANESFATAQGDSKMTARQVQVLAAIEANEGSSQTAIVDITGVDRSTLAEIVRRLLNKRLVERRRSEEDARSYVLKLTECGRQALASGRPARAAVEKGLLAVLPAKDRSFCWTSWVRRWRPMRHASELELLDLIEKCPTCRDRQIHAFVGDKFGVVITWEGAQVGLWGWIDDALRFRTLANWEPRITAADPETALAATVKMAEARNWTY